MEQNNYSYLYRDEFTSEIFKIEISNIPKFLNHSGLKKLFINKFKITPRKVKVISNNRKKSLYAFVTFQNEKERDKAIELSNGYVYKNCKLRVCKASPIKDPAVKKTLESDSKDVIIYENCDLNTLQEYLLQRICPLYKMDYQLQLELKTNSSKNILIEILNKIEDLHKQLKNETYLSKMKLIEEIHSEINFHVIKKNYRNKCEFSIGTDKVIGFRLGAYKNNNVKVVKPLPNCIILNDRMIKLIDVLEKFLTYTKLKVFDIQTHSGHLNQITVRTTKNDCMLIIVLNAANLEENEIKDEFKKLNDHLKEEASFVTSFYIQTIEKKLNENSKKINNLIHISDEHYVYEEINSLKFRISPFAFFQINVNAAQVLYETINSLAKLNKDMILLDICCGIGTIGIYLSNQVKYVIGIELVKEAIEDAKFNASINKIENIEFYVGKAEEQINKIIKKAKELGGLEIAAILNPPRAGLNNNIIKLIRNCKEITKLVYVSCEPRLAKQNLIDLCRPSSKAYQGTEFQLDKVKPVDMFPHTNQFEMVLLYTR